MCLLTITPVFAESGGAGSEPAASQTAEWSPDRGSSITDIVSDIRGGVLWQDADLINQDGSCHPFTSVDEGGVALNLAVLFQTPRFLEWALAPRPFFNMSISPSGQTSLWAGGLSWGHQFRFGLYLDGYLGAAVNDGELDEGGTTGVKEMGARVTPFFAAELGFRFDEAQHHGLALYVEHISHAKLFDQRNDALDNWGLRYSYRF